MQIYLFIYAIFNTNSLDYITFNGRMINKAIVALFKVPNIPACTWRDCEKPRKISVRVTDVQPGVPSNLISNLFRACYMYRVLWSIGLQQLD